MDDVGLIYCPRPRNATIFDLHITSFLSSKPKHQFSFCKFLSRNLSFQNMKYIKVLNVKKIHSFILFN